MLVIARRSGASVLLPRLDKIDVFQVCSHRVLRKGSLKAAHKAEFTGSNKGNKKKKSEKKKFSKEILLCLKG